MLRRLLHAALLALLLLLAPGAALAQNTAKVTGTVTYLDRSLQTTGSKLVIQLQDVSRADAVARVLADQTIDVGGRGGPFPFELSYNPASIAANGTYIVRAEIRNSAGTLLYTTTTQNRVLTGGGTSTVNITVQRVALPGTADGDTLLLLAGLLLAGAAGLFVLRRSYR